MTLGDTALLPRASFPSPSLLQGANAKEVKAVEHSD